MDPRPPKPNANPAARRAPETLAEAYRDRPSFSDSFPGAVLEPPQQPGELGRLGRYRILGELGRGGMGAVFRAEDPRLKRAVAVKVLLPELAADPRAKALFVREAQAQAKVEHDHIIAIHEVDEVRGVAFIVMPLLKGQTLASALKQNPRPPLAELVRIGREIAEGLGAAHDAGLIHRDIKPGNVWLEGNKRRVKILDFGLARHAAPATPGAAEPQSTGRGFVGTPAYMAPEQARSQPTDHRCDLFSLGVVLYQMATGTMPFTGPSAFDVMAAVVTHDPPAAHQLVPALPPALGELIGRLMAKNPADRPPTAEVVVEELDAIERGLAAVPVPVQVVPASGAAVALDPWADLDSAAWVDGDEDEDEDEDEDATVPLDRERPRARPGAPKWLWPAVGGVCALVLISGLLVTKPWKDKPRPEPAGDTKTAEAKPGGTKAPPSATGTPQPKPKVTPASALTDRQAAEWVQKQGGSVLVRGRRGAVDCGPAPQLPEGDLLLLEVSLRDVKKFDGTGLDNLSSCDHLTHIDLGGTAVRDDALVHICKLPSLTGLVLANTPITNAGVEHFKDCDRLTSLNLCSTDVTNDGLAYFKRCRNLSLLWLHNTGIDDDGLVHFRGLKSLKTVRLGWRVTDKALTYLVGCNALWELHIGGTRIGDAGLKHCHALTGLTLLYMHSTQATDAGVRALAAALPGCRIVWRDDAVLEEIEPTKPAPAPARPTGGLAFDGKSTRVTVPKLGFDGTVPLTIEAWVTPETLRYSHIILLGASGGGIGLSTAGALGVGFHDGAAWQNTYAREPLKAGETVHVAAVVTETGFVLYVNGKEMGAKPQNLGKLPPVAAPGLIGASTGRDGAAPFHGTIHGIRVSRGVRYAKDFTPVATWEPDANTIVLYRFDEGSGTTLKDHSKNGRDGTIENGTWVGPKK